MADLLSASDLPDGFDYPAEFVRLVELDLTNLEPWWSSTANICGPVRRHRGTLAVITRDSVDYPG